MIRRYLPWLALLGVVVAALVAGAGDGGTRTKADRVEAITSEVRCPTCQGLSAADSSAPAAQAVRSFVEEQVDAGLSDGEIKAALASRFGNDILLRPEAGGLAGLVWALPVAGLVLGVGGLAYAFHRWRRRPPSSSSRRKVAIAAVAVAATSVAGGWGLSSAMGERLPGEQATGSIVETPVDPLTRAQQLVSEGEILAAVKVYDEVLADNPTGRTRAIALAQRGWLISRAASADPALADRGLAQIDEAIATDPTYPDAYFFKGMLLSREKDDPVGAAVAYRQFLALDPPPELASFVEGELRAALASAEERGLAVPAPAGIPSGQADRP